MSNNLNELWAQGYRLFNGKITVDIDVPIIAENEDDASEILDGDIARLCDRYSEVDITELRIGQRVSFDDALLYDDINLDKIKLPVEAIAASYLEYRKAHPTRAQLEAAGQASFLEDE